MRYLVIGAGGLLGTAFVERLGSANVVTAGRADVDVRDISAIRALVRDAASEVVINCAAHTDVDGAERDPDPAYSVNAMLPLLLAQACREAGTRFVHFSSTGAYGNYLDRPYTEDDPQRPTTVHHSSKASGERLVRETGGDALILRTGWLFGGRVPKPRNFVRARLLEAAGKASMTSDASQTGNPTFVDDLVEQTLHLLDQRLAGTFNCVNAGAARRFDYVSAIVALSGRDCRVEPSTQPFKRAAAVSPNESARNFRLDLLGLNRMGPWQDAVARYIAAAKTWPEWADVFS